MNTVMPTMTVDVSPIERAVLLALRSTSRSMELVLGSTAYHVAWKAAKYTPFVELETIDREMEVTTTNIISAGNKGKTNLTVAQKIVLARMNPNSPFNLATDQRWAIPYQNLSGINRYYVLEDIAERMIRARHSSTHFLQSGWKAVKQQIKEMGFKIGSAAGGDNFLDDNPQNSLNPSKLGEVTRTGAGTPVQSITISNLIGTESGYPNLAREHNDALIAHGTPALERALAEQVEDMRQHYLPKAGADMVREWNSFSPAIISAVIPHVNSLRMAEIQSVADYDLGGELQADQALGSTF